MFKKRSAKIVPSSSSGVEREEEPKKKKIERVEKEDVEQRMKTNSESEAQEITKEMNERVWYLQQGWAVSECASCITGTRE